MKASDIVWDEENMEKFVAKPKAFLPGTKMVFAGLKKDDQRENLIAYLMQATK
jgi:cytochrome c